MHSMIDQLRRALATHARPGQPAQATMAPPGRERFPAAPANARHAAVLALLHQKHGEWYLLFIQRTNPPGDHHGGQISFPGGSVDPGDTSAMDTALREAEEEVGLDRSQVEVLGQLTPLYIPVSNFRVDPVVGVWGAAAGAKYRLQEAEVQRTLELPVTEFLRGGARKVRDRKTSRGLLLKSVPYYDVAGEQIWGATSMITAELLALLRK